VKDNQVTFSPCGGGIEIGDVMHILWPQPYRPRWYMMLLVVPWVRYRREMREWKRRCGMRFFVKSVTSHSFTLD
jgi:hypothetical protein